MQKRCRRCHKLLTWKEELYNHDLCDECLQKEQEAFIHKGGSNAPETAKED